MRVINATARNTCFTPSPVRKVCDIVFCYLLSGRFPSGKASIQRRQIIYARVYVRVVSTRGTDISTYIALLGRSSVWPDGSSVLFNIRSPVTLRQPGGSVPFGISLVPLRTRGVNIRAYSAFTSHSPARNLYITWFTPAPTFKFKRHMAITTTTIAPPSAGSLTVGLASLGLTS